MDSSNIILNGDYSGKTLYEYFQYNKKRFHLDSYNEFPIVIALVEANDSLSIQVHPDSHIAKILEGRPHGKNESWYFIESPTDGWIYNGCRCKDKSEVIDMISNEETNKVVDHLSINNGDYVFIEAGTLHALTKGSYIYEIEENCNLTYRLYDFDRKDDQGNSRELHIEKAIEALNTSKKSTPVKLMENTIKEERMYVLRRLESVTNYQNISDTLECLTLIKGEFSEQEMFIRKGTSIILEPGECLSHFIESAIVARPK